MKEEFIKKLNSNKYISKHLYENIYKINPEIIPLGFDIDLYNNKILDKEYLEYKNYFQNMYKGIDDNIVLDEDQIKAILADEDFSLIIAGAGTGKTTTMASKVKYLVDIKGIEPEKIVVMSYTKKATEELEKRIVVDFGIPAKVTTFHSLGMMYIREIFCNRNCYIVDDNLKNDIFLEYFKNQIFPYKDKVKEILKYFSIVYKNNKSVLSKHFTENYENYQTYEEYFDNYKESKLKEIVNLKEEIKRRIDNGLNNEIPFTIKNEIVKSKGEAEIANFLFCNGIDYKYEKIYKEKISNNSIYRPDFTLELGGEEVYLEYFGLSNYTKDKLNRYNKIKKFKEDYHKKHNTRFIKLDYMPNENLILNLKEQLLNMGFNFKPKTDKEIFYRMLENNPIAPIFQYKDFLYDVIEKIKSSVNRKDYYTIIQKYISKLSNEEQKEAKIQFKYIDEFYKFYQNKLYGVENYGFDFSDMIYYANRYMENISYNNTLNFKYLIIDEYQDISQERYEFTKKIVNRNNAKVVAVGDDWQSIFSFAGSKIKYIYNFTKYFDGAKLLKISKTYRNSQQLIDYSGAFIMKNKDQIDKQLISNKSIDNPIKFLMFDDQYTEYDVLKKLIIKIHQTNPSHNILILARKNETIDRCFEDSEFIDDLNTKIKFVGYEDIDIDGMTIHKSKGLTSDETIIIGLDQTFPNSNYIQHWIMSLFEEKLEDESIPFAEERRSFYVALTRTKNYVYLLVNKDPKLRSPFINEIYQTIKNYDK